jgi:hypothetical protein
MSKDDLDSLSLGIRITGVLWFVLGSIYFLIGLVVLFLAVWTLSFERVYLFVFFVFAFIGAIFLGVALLSIYVGVGFWRLNPKAWKVSIIISGLAVLLLSRGFFGLELWAFLVLLLIFLLHLGLLIGAFLVRDQFRIATQQFAEQIPGQQLAAFCQQCGTKNLQGHQFCMNCGANLLA